MNESRRDAAGAGEPTRLLPTLTLLLDNHLISVTDTLTLVRLRRTLRADNRSKVTNLNLVKTADRNIRVAIALDFETLRDFHNHRVGITQAQVQVLALHRRLVTNPKELELLLEPRGHTHHHVVRQRAVQAVTLARIRGVIRARQLDGFTLLRENNDVRELHLHGTLRTLYMCACKNKRIRSQYTCQRLVRARARRRVKTLQPSSPRWAWSAHPVRARTTPPTHRARAHLHHNIFIALVNTYLDREHVVLQRVRHALGHRHRDLADARFLSLNRASRGGLRGLGALGANRGVTTDERRYLSGEHRGRCVKV
mmetsp:Transcript_524/g.1657  ORF Transcript_524/g.1657 Transcript_524/m.1657 type:complete len:311 (+) Transcript_524:133-1065(+)